MGPRGDAIAQTDWCVGQIIDKLSEKGILDDTLILFTSDNGPVIDDGYQDDAVKKNPPTQRSFQRRQIQCF